MVWSPSCAETDGQEVWLQCGRENKGGSGLQWRLVRYGEDVFLAKYYFSLLTDLVMFTEVSFLAESAFHLFCL